MTSEAPATAPAATAKNQPHPLLDMALTVILPSIVLESLSKPERLGPAWALGVALLIPLGFGIWCFKNKRGLNFFSIFGLVAIATSIVGALVLLAGFVVGFPCGSTVVASLGPEAPARVAP